MGAPKVRSAPPALVGTGERIQSVLVRTPGIPVQGQLQSAFDAAKGWAIDDKSPIGVRLELAGVTSVMVPWGDVRAVFYRVDT